MPNLGRTLFAAELARHEAERQRQREDDLYFAESMERNAKVRAIQDEQRRKDLEAKAAIVGQQAEAIGIEQPALTQPGMRVAQQIGAGESKIAQLHAARKAEAAQRLERLKQLGLIDKAALEHEFNLELEDVRGRNRIAASRARGPSVVNNVGQGGGLALPAAERNRAANDVRTAQTGREFLRVAEESIMAAGGYDAIGDYGESGKAWLADKALKIPLVRDQVPAGTDQWLDTRTAATAALADFSNEMLHKRGGAVLPPAEYERLKRSLPMHDDSGPVLRAKIAFWNKHYDLVERQGLKALMHGLATGAIQAPVAPGVTQPMALSREAEADEYASQLEASGSSPDEVDAALMQRFPDLFGVGQ